MPNHIKALFILFTLSANCIGSSPDHVISTQTPSPQTPSTLAKIKQTLSLTTIVSGKFTQRRTLVGFDHSLESQGRYIYWKEKGLYWEMSKPFYRATTFRNDKTISWSSAEKITNESKPNIIQKQINKVLVAVLGGDLISLDNYFHIKASFDEARSERWHVELSPKDSSIAKTITQLELSGKKDVENITIISAAGEKTYIEFAEIKAENNIDKQDCKMFYPKDVKACKSDKA